MTTKIGVRKLAVTVALAIFAAPSSLRAQDAASLFKSKCSGCHGSDGAGSAMGKKMGVHDFSSADTQKMSDTELANTITNGRNKMPPFKSLTPDQLKGLVAYIRGFTK